MQWNADERWQRMQDRDLPHYRDRRKDRSHLKSSGNDISAGLPRKAASKPKSSKEHLAASQPRKVVSSKKASPASHTKAAFDEVRSCRATMGCLMCHFLVQVSHWGLMSKKTILQGVDGQALTGVFLVATNLCRGGLVSDLTGASRHCGDQV